MSREAWRASATTDALFPDDLEGCGPLQVVGEPLPAEEADTDTVSYGTVAVLNGDAHEAEYLVAPRQLRELIADAWRDDVDAATFEVLSAEKGPADDDEWEIDGRVIENGDHL